MPRSCAVWLQLSRLESRKLQAPRDGSTLIWFLSNSQLDVRPPFPESGEEAGRRFIKPRHFGEPQCWERPRCCRVSLGGGQATPAGLARLLGWQQRLRGAALAPREPVSMAPLRTPALGWARPALTCPHLAWTAHSLERW